MLSPCVNAEIRNEPMHYTMPKLYFSILLLFGVLSAQSPFTIQSDTLRYRISAHAAGQFFQGRALDSAATLSFVDTLRSEKQGDKRQLPPGYYLDVYAVNNDLQQAVFVRAAIDWYLAEVKGKAILKVSSHQGQPASLFKSKGKKLRFDSELNGWRIPQKAYGGTHLLVAGSDSLWVFLDGEKQRKRKTYYWNAYANSPDTRSMLLNNRGYIITHQPMYRRGDSVHIKAYVRRWSGRPYQGKLEIGLFKNPENRNWYSYSRTDPYVDPIFKDTIQESRPGAYVYSFVAADSLKLDKEYALKISGHNFSLITDFRLEDYVLEDAQFEATYFSDSLGLGIAPMLKLEATSANGMPIMDGTATIRVSRKEVFEADFTKTVTSFPDILFSDTLQLDPSGNTFIHLPDSSLDYLGASWEVNVRFTDGGGNIEDTVFTLKLLHPKPTLHHRWLAGQLFIDSIAYPLGWHKARPETVMVRGDRRQYSGMAKNYFLPAAIPFAVQNKRYVIENEVLSEHILVPLNQVEGFFQTQNDSLFFEFSNPAGLMTHVEFWQKGKVVKHMDISGSDRISLKKIPTHARWSYFWAGKLQKRSLDYQSFPNALMLEIDQPAMAAPGDSVDVTLRLKKQDGSPVAHADLSAWAIHSRFGNIDMPILSGSNEELIHRYVQQRLESNLLEGSRSLSLDEDWAKKLAVYDTDGWRFLYPDSLHCHYQSMACPDTNLAAIAIFPRWRGWKEKVKMIWMGGKLVYSSAFDGESYVVVALRGLYNIKVRTEDHIYFLPNIKLKKGQKLDLSFNYMEMRKQPDFRPMPKTLTIDEALELNTKSLYLEPMQNSSDQMAYASDRLRVWPLPPRTGYGTRKHLLGPVQPGTLLELGRKDRFSFYQPFYTGYTHQFRSRMVKLDKAPTFSVEDRWSKLDSRQQPGEIPLWLADFKAPEVKKKRAWRPVFVPYTTPRYSDFFESCKLHCIGKKAKKIVRVSLQEDRRVWNFRSRGMVLPAGRQSLFIHLDDSTFTRLDFSFKKNKTYWIQVDSLQYVTDTITHRLKARELFQQEDFYRGNGTLTVRFPAGMDTSSVFMLGREANVLFSARLSELGMEHTFEAMPSGVWYASLISPRAAAQWHHVFTVSIDTMTLLDVQKEILQSFKSKPSACPQGLTHYRLRYQEMAPKSLENAYWDYASSTLNGFVFTMKKLKVEGAKLILVKDGKVVSSTSSDSAGYYQLRNIPVGYYTMHVLSNGSEEVIRNVAALPGIHDLNVLCFSHLKTQKAYIMNFDKNWFHASSEFGIEFFKSSAKGDTLINTLFDQEILTGPEGKLAGNVYDASGEAASYATILVYDEQKAFVNGAQANVLGEYSIWPLEAGMYDIQFKYVDRDEVVTKVSILPSMTRFLDMKFRGIGPTTDEVVIMSSKYDIPVFEKDAPSGQVISNEEVTAIATRDVTYTPGIQVRGARANATVYYVDGQKIRGGVNLPQSSIATLQVITGGTPASFGDGDYGRSYGWSNPYRPSASRGNVRKDLSEDESDRFGERQLLTPAFRIRDDWRDYAYWQPLLHTNEQGEAHFRTVLPGQLTQWNSYAIAAAPDGRMALVQGRVRAVQKLAGKLDVPRFLLADDSVMLRGRALNYTDSTLIVRSSFRLGEKEVYQWKDSLEDIHKDELAVIAEGDSMEVTYLVELDTGYGDGERRDIPVLPVGMERNVGDMLYLEGDSTHELTLARSGPSFELLIAASPLEMLLDRLDHLKNYPHACNEQTASKLMGLLLKQAIYDTLEKEFSEKELIDRMVNRLEKHQNEDGGWGWWPNRDSRMWVTLHVVKTLGKHDPKHPALANGHRYLVEHLDEVGVDAKLKLLHYFAEHDVDVAVESMLAEIPDSLNERIWTHMLRARLLRSMNKPWIDDSLFARIDSFKTEGNDWKWFGSSLDQILLAYELTHDQDSVKSSLPRRKLMLDELAEYRYNTIQTAKAMAVIVPDLLANRPRESEIETSIRVSGLDEPIEQFPFRTTMNMPPDRKLKIQKRGLSPMTLTVVQSYWESHPQRTDSIFAIHSTWHQDGKSVDSVRSGSPLTCRVTVHVKETAKEAALIIPIPANCFWQEKPGAKRNEAHREYEKDRLNIYFDHLRPGRYRFELKLEPRFRGRFTVNPVQCFPMYEPLRSGNTVIKELDCEK
jgi:hypothetical protein